VGKRNDENFSYFNYFLLLFFLNLCMGYRVWGSIWGEICPIFFFFFFSEFVCGLSPVCGLLFSQFFFFLKIVLALLNLDLLNYLFFMVRGLKF
jgi:hypothetical protein